MKLTVNKGMGTIIGSALRQIAIKSVSTWQPIAVYVEKFNGSYGVDNAPGVSVVDFLSLQFKPKDDLDSASIGSIETVTFYRSGDVFNSNFGTLSGMGNVPLDYLKVIMSYNIGYKTPKDNKDIIDSLVSLSSDDNIIYLPSRHNVVDEFTFKVESVNASTETLDITARDDILSLAIEKYKGVFNPA